MNLRVPAEESQARAARNQRQCSGINGGERLQARRGQLPGSDVRVAASQRADLALGVGQVVRGPRDRNAAVS